MSAQPTFLAAARAQRLAVAAPPRHVATYRQQTLSFANNLQIGGRVAARSASDAYLSMPHTCDACGRGFKRLQALKSHEQSSAHRHKLRFATKRQLHHKGVAPMPQASSSRASSSPAAVQPSATPAPRTGVRTARASPKAVDAGPTSAEPGAPPEAVTTGLTPEPFAIGGKGRGSCISPKAATRAEVIDSDTESAPPAGSRDVARVLGSATYVVAFQLKPKRAARPPCTLRVSASHAGAPLSAASARAIRLMPKRVARARCAPRS
jgi:hypothetical protein